MGKGARRTIRVHLARLRVAERAFAHRPAFARWHLESVLWLPDLRDALRESGVDPRPFEPTIRTAEECAEFAREALEGRAWDAAAMDVARVAVALERLSEPLGLPHPHPTAPPSRRGTLRLILSLVRLLRPDSPPYAAWRRLDLALATLQRTRRTSDPNMRTFLLRRFADPDRLQPHLSNVLGRAHRDAQREAWRLFAEAEETADFAIAALDQRAFSAAEIDLERFDAALRALRNVVRRESPVYLPEPWPVRRLARWSTAKRIRREADLDARRLVIGLEARLERMRPRSLGEDREAGQPP